MRKTAIITGGGRGIGRAIALTLARRKMDVVVTYVARRDCCEQTATEVRALGCEALVAQVDVSQRESISRVISTVLEKFARIDVLVNNAGILQQKPFATISEEEWDAMMAVNLKGAFLCSREILPLMIEQGSGSIVNVASSGGQLGGTLAVHYATSKAGLISLTRSLARIGAAAGVRVNCVAPGLIDTEMTAGEIASPGGRAKIEQQIPLRRPGRVEEVAAAVAFLVSDSASYITGHTLNVNGGLYI